MTDRAIRRVLLILLGLGVLLLIASLPGQRIHGDEAAFAEFAWFQSQDGYVHTELFRGLLEYETRVLLYHKLFIWLGAGMVSLFGYGIWPLRALSLLSTLALALLPWRFVRGQDSGTRTLTVLAAMTFVLLAPLTFKFAKFYRPEMMQAVTGLALYFALERGVRDDRMALYVLAGFAAGTSVLMHLNGVVYVIAGATVLLLRRRWKGTLAYGAAAAIAVSPFFFEIIGRFDLFWLQYNFDPTFGENERTVAGTLLKLVEEHKRLFRSPEIIFSTVLFITALIANVRSEGWRRRDFHVLTFASMVALGALAPAKTTPYAILLFPFWAIEVGHWIGRLPVTWRSTPALFRSACGIVIAAFVVHSLVADSVNALSDKQDWIGENTRALAVVPEGARILGPLDLVLDELPDRQIAGLRLAEWRIHDWGQKPYTLQTLTAYADSAGCAALVLDRELWRRFGLSGTPETPPANGYRLVYSDPDGNRFVFVNGEKRESGPGD
ncbi:MAG: glycosyltransferase family 39 protein [Candidatus Zixiibacteriota bacterium]